MVQFRNITTEVVAGVYRTTIFQDENAGTTDAIAATDIDLKAAGERITRYYVLHSAYFSHDEIVDHKWMGIRITDSDWPESDFHTGGNYTSTIVYASQVVKAAADFVILRPDEPQSRLHRPVFLGRPSDSDTAQIATVWEDSDTYNATFVINIYSFNLRSQAYAFSDGFPVSVLLSPTRIPHF